MNKCIKKCLFLFPTYLQLPHIYVIVWTSIFFTKQRRFALYVVPVQAVFRSTIPSLRPVRVWIRIDQERVGGFETWNSAGRYQQSAVHRDSFHSGWRQERCRWTKHLTSQMKIVIKIQMRHSFRIFFKRYLSVGQDLVDVKCFWTSVCLKYFSFKHFV